VDDYASFKEMTNEMMKDIKVTEVLKRDTINKCKAQGKNKKRTSHILSTLTIATAACFMFFISNSHIRSFQLKNSEIISDAIMDSNMPIKEKSIENEAKENELAINNNAQVIDQADIAMGEVESGEVKEVIQEVIPETIPETIPERIQKPTDNVNTSKNVAPAIDNKTVEESTSSTVDKSKEEPIIAKAAQHSELAIASLADKPKTTDEKENIEEARIYMEGKLLLPEYIPLNFMLEEVFVPTDKDKDNQEVKLSYSNADKSFSIIASKASFEQVMGVGKSVDINGVSAQLIEKENKPSFAETAQVSKITWSINNILYTIDGNISEEEAIKIAKSMK
jgi:hypothetical protein